MRAAWWLSIRWRITSKCKNKEEIEQDKPKTKICQEKEKGAKALEDQQVQVEEKKSEDDNKKKKERDVEDKKN